MHESIFTMPYETVIMSLLVFMCKNLKKNTSEPPQKNNKQTSQRIMQATTRQALHSKVNIQLNQWNCKSRSLLAPCIHIPVFGEVCPWEGVGRGRRVICHSLWAMNGAVSLLGVCVTQGLAQWAGATSVCNLQSGAKPTTTQDSGRRRRSTRFYMLPTLLSFYWSKDGIYNSD